MARAGSTKDVHILVQLDRLEDQKTRRFRIIQGDGFKKDCIETFSETNTGEACADPPAILIDERQKLFFYWGVPVLLRPASFSYMLLLAQTPGELVMREIIYRRLWPGEINFEGTNKPYERQINDQKR